MWSVVKNSNGSIQNQLLPVLTSMDYFKCTEIFAEFHVFKELARKAIGINTIGYVISGTTMNKTTNIAP